MLAELQNLQPELGVGQAKAMLRRWYIEDKGATEVTNSNMY